MLNFIQEVMTESVALCNLDMKKAQVVSESARRELALNYEQAELKVMNENGTTDDLHYYYTEAKEGFVGTIAKCIKKIKDAILKFFSTIKTKIVSFIHKQETTDAVEKIEKKVKLVPFLKKKKVLVENYNEEAKLANETISKLNKIKAKAMGNQEVTVEEIDEVKKTFLEKHGKLIGVGMAATVSIGVALTLIKNMQKESENVTVKFEEISKKACEDAEKMISKVNNPVVASKYADAVATVTKTTQESFIRTWKGAISTVGQAVKTQGKTKINGSDVAKILDESTDDISKMSAADIDKIAKSSASPSQTTNKGPTADSVNEDGENPMNDVPEEDPSETSDVWDDVMSGLDTSDTDGIDIGDVPTDDSDDESPVIDDEVDTECGSKCGTECGACEGADIDTPVDDPKTDSEDIPTEESTEEPTEESFDDLFERSMAFMEASSKNATNDSLSNDIIDFKSIISKSTDDNDWVGSAKKPSEEEVVSAATKDVECPEVTQKEQYSESVYEQLVNEISSLS